MDVKRDWIHARTRILSNCNTDTGGPGILSELPNVTIVRKGKIPAENWHWISTS